MINPKLVTCGFLCMCHHQLKKNNNNKVLSNLLKALKQLERFPDSVQTSWFGLVTKSCPTLVIPCTENLLGCSVHGILQARILEWVVIPFSRGSSQPRNRTQVSCTVRQILYQLSHQGNPWVSYYSFLL